MANEHKWISTDTDWNAAGSWDDGVVPSGNLHVAFFDDVQTDALVNLDRTGDTSIKRIVTSPRYGGNIGAPGNPLMHEMNSTGASDSRIVHRGSGDFYFLPTAGGFTDVFVDSRGGALRITDGTVRNAFVRGGLLTIAAIADFTGYLVMDGPNAHVVIEAPSGSELRPTLYIIGAGHLENKAAAGSTTFVLGNGARVTQTGKLDTSDSIIVTRDGRFDYLPGVTQTGNPARIVVLGALEASSHFDLKTVDLVIGAQGVLSGPVSQSTPFGPSGVDIDFRKEFP